MYSPWTTSMPCLFSNNSNISSINEDCLISSLNNLDLSNPFNMVATLSPTSSLWSLENFSINLNDEQELKKNYFEPLPFFDTDNQIKSNNYPQLSQKHNLIKQMIARKAKQQYHNHSSRSHHNSHDNLLSTRSHRKKRPICTFCKSNGESANVFTSHVLRNINNEIECPILMSYICPKCGATGKSAHTIKYCPALSENERVALPTVKLFKEGRTSSGNKNLFKK